MTGGVGDAVELALRALETAQPTRKAAMALSAFESLKGDTRGGGLCEIRRADMIAPSHPARPSRPELKPPSEVPRRRLGSPQGRVALLHALAHIEFNAIDLACDMAVRFSEEIASAGLDVGLFIADWIEVGADEARHFSWLSDRLAELGAGYGDLPAHDGLWEAAEKTMDGALPRLAIAPMALEARGLDVTPAMAERLRAVNDPESAAILERIYQEEHAHVAAGVRWFETLCEARGLYAPAEFRKIAATRFPGVLKPPFNEEARSATGLRSEYYQNWNGFCD